MPPKPPKKTQKQSKKQPKPAAAPTAQDPQDITAEQSLLDVFNATFRPLLTSPGLHERIQSVKDALYRRDYLEAFGAREKLEAYVVRWSPSRALAYRWVVMEAVGREVREVFTAGEGGKREIVCIGAGAGGELAGIAGALAGLLSTDEEDASEGRQGEKKFQVKMTAVDIAAWDPIFSQLVETIHNPKPVGNTNRLLFKLPSTVDFQPAFMQADILSPDFPSDVISQTTSLITLLFTTNELYTQSMSRTSTFLLSLRARTSPGCLLLVLESAGSYSTVKFGEKEYPMGSFLDFTMVGKGDKGWEKVFETDSKWYRLPEGLKYPVELENMRFMARVYRRVENKD